MLHTLDTGQTPTITPPQENPMPENPEFLREGTPQPFLTTPHQPDQETLEQLREKLQQHLQHLETRPHHSRFAPEIPDLTRITALTLAAQTTTSLDAYGLLMNATDTYGQPHDYFADTIAALTLGVADRYLQWLNNTTKESNTQ